MSFDPVHQTPDRPGPRRGVPQKNNLLSPDFRTDNLEEELRKLSDSPLYSPDHKGLSLTPAAAASASASASASQSSRLRYFPKPIVAASVSVQQLAAPASAPSALLESAGKRVSASAVEPEHTSCVKDVTVLQDGSKRRRSRSPINDMKPLCAIEAADQPMAAAPQPSNALNNKPKPAASRLKPPSTIAVNSLLSNQRAGAIRPQASAPVTNKQLVKPSGLKPPSIISKPVATNIRRASASSSAASTAVIIQASAIPSSGAGIAVISISSSSVPSNAASLPSVSTAAPVSTDDIWSLDDLYELAPPVVKIPPPMTSVLFEAPKPVAQRPHKESHHAVTLSSAQENKEEGDLLSSHSESLLSDISDAVAPQHERTPSIELDMVRLNAIRDRYKQLAGKTSSPAVSPIPSPAVSCASSESIKPIVGDAINSPTVLALRARAAVVMAVRTGVRKDALDTISEHTQGENGSSSSSASSASSAGSAPADLSDGSASPVSQTVTAVHAEIEAVLRDITAFEPMRSPRNAGSDRNEHDASPLPSPAPSEDSFGLFSGTNGAQNLYGYGLTPFSTMSRASSTVSDKENSESCVTQSDPSTKWVLNQVTCRQLRAPAVVEPAPLPPVAANRHAKAMSEGNLDPASIVVRIDLPPEQAVKLETPQTLIMMKKSRKQAGSSEESCIQEEKEDINTDADADAEAEIDQDQENTRIPAAPARCESDNTTNPLSTIDPNTVLDDEDFEMHATIDGKSLFEKRAEAIKAGVWPLSSHGSASSTTFTHTSS